jgi:hypothetical protein
MTVPDRDRHIGVTWLLRQRAVAGRLPAGPHVLQLLVVGRDGRADLFLGRPGLRRVEVRDDRRRHQRDERVERREHRERGFGDALGGAGGLIDGSMCVLLLSRDAVDVVGDQRQDEPQLVVQAGLGREPRRELVEGADDDRQRAGAVAVGDEPGAGAQREVADEGGVAVLQVQRAPPSRSG